MRPLLATYRLQFREGMDFARAADLAPYLAALGVSHLYASPIFRAAPGSSHGYDVADFNAVEPALGGRTGFERMRERLRTAGLGVILDFVPNHMAATPYNPWWRDVLEWGADSPHANVFDIDWTTPKLVIPALGQAYGRVLAAGELSLAFDAADGGMSMVYHDLRLPLTPPTYAQVLALGEDERLIEFANRFAVSNAETAPELKDDLAEAAREQGVRDAVERAVRAVVADRERLHALHESQVWQLMHWRAARERLTYRRFFEIADLVGVRMEQPSVFDQCHSLVLELVGEDGIDGLRLDHIDGLADPKGYLQRLQQALPAQRHSHLWVEKILGPGETLRADWPAAGTTGYEFILALAGLFTRSSGEAELTAAYTEFAGEWPPYGELVLRTKRHIFTRNLAGELDVLTRLAVDLAAADLDTRDLGPDTLRRAIIEVATALQVYRTYVDVEGPSADDRMRIEAAAAQAKLTREVEDESAIDFIARLLLLDIADPERRANALVFTTRFQQTTGPLMAKAVEDTLFYRYNRLIALNEVGGEPDVFGWSMDAFHKAMRERRERQPFGLSTTSTHDTKRGEDARARLYALSEAPLIWRNAVMQWRDMNGRLRAQIDGLTVPSPNDEWLYYQALLGAWPPELTAEDGDGLSDLADRMVAFLHKAAREAKLYTSWTAPAQAYEDALEQFVRATLDPGRSPAFLADFQSVAATFIRAGAVNSLAQTLIKLTCPGVPDIYQGAELWDLSLVDPDNRRPVDFEFRRRALDGLPPLHVCLETWRDGRAKLALLSAGLSVRGSAPEMCATGDYLPLAVSGPCADHILAYARCSDGGCLIAVAPRWPLSLLRDGDLPRLDAQRLSGTLLAVPEGFPARWRDPLCERDYAPATGGHLDLAALLERCPVALLLAGR